MQRSYLWSVLTLMVLVWTMWSLPVYAQSLKQTNFEDGTGSVGLPAGWRIIEAYHGTVSCAKQADMSVRFGMPWVIDRPDSSISQFAASSHVPVAPIGDLPDAIRGILGIIGAHLVSLRSRPAPAAFPGVPAYYLIYRFTQGKNDYTGLGYFTTINPSMGSPYWNMYSSAVIARTSLFMKSLPTMMSMWRSWRPNGQKPKAGSESAVIDEMIAHTKNTYDQLNAKFDATIRGE